jgi:hypothetical protein
MSELAQLLELLYRAHASFRSMRGVMREWRDLELSEQAMRHELEEQERAKTRSTSSNSAKARPAAKRPPRSHRQLSRGTVPAVPV